MSEFEDVATATENNTPSLSPTVKGLEGLFESFNKSFFNSALSRPVITLSQKGTRSTKGWCTEKKVWTQLNNNSASERYYEISICPEYLNQPVEEICGVLLHEMVHLYNVINGKRDCTSNGQYHNKTFKESAEQHGLKVEKTARYGYAQTSLKPETLSYIKTLDLTAFDLYRDSVQKQSQGSEETVPAKKTSSTRSYICPRCSTLIRATKEVRVKCEGCNTLFVERRKFEQEKLGILYPIKRR